MVDAASNTRQRPDDKSGRMRDVPKVDIFFFFFSSNSICQFYSSPCGSVRTMTTPLDRMVGRKRPAGPSKWVDTEESSAQEGAPDLVVVGWLTGVSTNLPSLTLTRLDPGAFSLKTTRVTLLLLLLLLPFLLLSLTYTKSITSSFSFEYALDSRKKELK